MKWCLELVSKLSTGEWCVCIGGQMKNEWLYINHYWSWEVVTWGFILLFSPFLMYVKISIIKSKNNNNKTISHPLTQIIFHFGIYPDEVIWMAYEVLCMKVISKCSQLHYSAASLTAVNQWQPIAVRIKTKNLSPSAGFWIIWPPLTLACQVPQRTLGPTTLGFSQGIPSPSHHPPLGQLLLLLQDPGQYCLFGRYCCPPQMGLDPLSYALTAQCIPLS